MLLALLGWIAVGLIVGFLGTKFVNMQGDTPLFAFAIAAAGAVVGGFVFAYVSGHGILAWDTLGVLIAGVGAIAATVIYHLVRSRSITRSSHTVRSSY